MRLIIVEGTDRIGKNTLISNLIKHSDDNITIRHFGKPPKELVSEKSIDFQFESFYEELELIEKIETFSNSRYNMYDNTIIWNRSHIGEYVYSQLYRNSNKDEVYDRILKFEKKLPIQTFFILLTIPAKEDYINSIISNDDGKSLSKTLIQKEKELNLFDEIFEKSSIKNKKRVESFGLDIKNTMNLEIPIGIHRILNIPYKQPQLIFNEVNEFLND